MKDRYEERLHRTAAGAEAAGLRAVAVAPSPDLLYLTGYDPPPLERLTMLAILPGREPVLLVPELERARAGESPVGRRIEIATWADGDDPYAAAAALLPPQGRVAAGDRMWAAHLLGLQRAVPGASFEPAGPVIARLRAVKDERELELLARAGRAADDAFRRLAETRLEGLREEEVSRALLDLLVESGHDRADFAIVASGPNGASPHHEPAARAIRSGDALVLDFGGALGGYFSDTTRTVCVGSIPGGFEEVYDVVREAQEAAVRAVAPGVPAEDVDRAARRVIEDAGFGERFIHRTGHGIGLEVHEAPWIVAGNPELLRPGMCFSVEPGIYLEGRFGVRIEDSVTVTQDGVSRLNHSPRELLTLR